MHRLTSTWDRVFGKLRSKRTSKKRKGLSPLKRRSFSLEPLEERTLLSVNPFGDETLLNSYTAEAQKLYDSSDAVAGNVFVSSSTERALDVGVSLPAAKFQERELSDNNIYSDLMVPGAGEGKIGTPNLPVFGSWILIPNGTEVSISADPGKAEVYGNISLPPVQPPAPKSADDQEPAFVKDETVFLDEADFPGVFAETEDIKYKRGQACTILWVYPYQYNPVQEELKVYPDLEVTVEFDGVIQSIPLNLQNENYGNFMSMAINAKEVLSAEGYENKSQLVPGKHNVDGSKEEIAAEEALKVNGNPNDGSMATMDYGYEEGCDMLIITHPNFEDAADTLAEWKIKKGLYTTVVTTNTTGSTSSNIEDYIDDAFSTWDPAPSYLLLMGDAEQVPTCYVTEHPYESGYTASDLHYADVNTPTDYVADMAYGRLSVDTLAQANNVVNHIIAYEEGTGLTSSYFNKATITGAFQDGLSSAPDTMADLRFAKTCEDIRNYLNDEESYTTERIYNTYNGYNSAGVFPKYWAENSYFCFENDTPGAEIPSHLQKPTFPWDGSTTDITNAVEDGTFLLVNIDHGLPFAWVTPWFDNDDVDQLDNGNLRPIIWSSDCNTGRFDAGSECFTEHWLRHDTGGSVGLMGSSRVAFAVHSDRLVWGMMDAIWDDFLGWCTASYPDHDPIYSTGDVLSYGKEYYMTKFADGRHRKATVEEYHWFGDPSMEIWTGTPATISPTYSDIVTTGSTSLYVQTGISGAIVGLSQNGNYIGKGTAAANGNVTVTFDNQPSVGVMDIYISAHNYYIHKGTVDVVAVNDMGSGNDAYDDYYASDNATEISTNASGTGYIQFFADQYDQYKIPVSSDGGNDVTVSFTAPAGSSSVDVVFYDTDKSFITGKYNVGSFTKTVTTSGDGYLYLVIDADLYNDVGIYGLSVSVGDMGSGGDAYDSLYANNNATEISTNASGTGHIQYPGDQYDQYKIPVSSGDGNYVTVSFTAPAGSSGVDVVFYDTDKSYIGAEINVGSFTETITTSGNGYLYLTVCAELSNDVGFYELSVSAGDMGTGGDAFSYHAAHNNATALSTNASGIGHIRHHSDQHDQYKIPVSSGDGNYVTVSFTAPAGSSSVDVLFYDTDKSYIKAKNNVSSFTETITTSGNGYLYLIIDTDYSNDVGFYELSVSAGDMGSGGDAYGDYYNANDNATELSTNASGTGHIRYYSDEYDQYKIPVGSGGGNDVTVSFTAPAGSSGIDVLFYDTDKSYITSEDNVSSFTETITTSGDGYLYLTIDTDVYNDVGIYELSVSVGVGAMGSSSAATDYYSVVTAQPDLLDTVKSEWQKIPQYFPRENPLLAAQVAYSLKTDLGVQKAPWWGEDEEEKEEEDLKYFPTLV